MNVCQKILYHHAVGLSEDHPPYVSTGEVICVCPDWILASEAAWYGMDKMYTGMGRPGVRRPDRFWLAGDHVVDPRVNHLAKNRELIERCDRIAKEMELGDNYRGHNTTIMHTEYYRQRVLPGMLVIGADSHTGSAGCLGALAIGMGITDVVIQLVTGETYIQVPEVVKINLVGKPPKGMGGKDIILGILGQLKRNTVAAERLVEYTGPGLQYLSSDARFAICNMTTEFGGIGACVVPDGITAAYVAKRKNPWRKGALYFRPDEDAQYAQTCDVDISLMETLVALYPSPDNVVPISQVDLKLDGCFIGACTTTEEELIFAGMVIQECLRSGMQPCSHGLRRVTPGALTITKRLEELGLLDAYEEAGFVIGAPGCSYCVGMGPDQASEGEVWLSSQNRNFRDRMGKGAIGNISSAAAVAVSSFNMKVTDPQPFIDAIWEKFEKTRRIDTAPFEISEPAPLRSQKIALETSTFDFVFPKISGRVQRFGDSIDTDSIIPADKCMQMNGQRVDGRGAFCYYRPEFYKKVQSGATIVVAGKMFGSGSSREQAPIVLQSAGIQAVIARSYAFIYARNQANNGLLGIRMNNDEFYKLAQEDAHITIDMEKKILTCEGREFKFKLDPIEQALLQAGGLLNVYRRYGTSLFQQLQSAADTRTECGIADW